MFMEPMICHPVPLRFSGYIWLDTKIVFKKKIKIIFDTKCDHSPALAGNVVTGAVVAFAVVFVVDVVLVDAVVAAPDP